MAADRSAQPVDVLAVMDQTANLLPDKACCGMPQWSGHPDDVPECCATPIDPSVELREARVAVAELVEDLRLLAAGESRDEHGRIWAGFDTDDVIAFARRALARMGSQP